MTKKMVLIVISFSVFLFFITFTNNKLVYINTASLIGSQHRINCISNWKCNSWTACDTQGKSYRKCTDINNCEDPVSPNTTRACRLTPEMLSSYQNDYEKKLLIIGGYNSKIKIDFTNGIPEQNDENCQYVDDTTPACYYFNLPGNVSIKFLEDSTAENSASGKMIFINGETNKELITGIKNIKDLFTKTSAGFYVNPTNIKNIFYVYGGQKIENNIVSWKEIYFDVLNQDILFYADAGAESENAKKSFVNIKKGAKEEYDINVNLPDNCTYPEKYELNGVFINGKKNNIFPASLKFDCGQDEKSYSSSIEIEPLAISNDFKTLHLFVHKYKNDDIKEDDVEWHYLFDLTTGSMKFEPNN